MAVEAGEGANQSLHLTPLRFAGEFHVPRDPVARNRGARPDSEAAVKASLSPLPLRRSAPRLTVAFVAGRDFQGR